MPTGRVRPDSRGSRTVSNEVGRTPGREGSPSVAVIGGGMTGILAGYQLKQAGFSDFTIFEKSDDVGGTWHVNTYPGLCCDVPSHIYSYTFRPNLGWTKVFAPQGEIKAYFRQCAEEFGIMPHVRLNSTVVQIVYEEDRQRWRVETADGAVQWFNYVINAGGTLTDPVFPDFAKEGVFKGAAWHSARWDHTFDLKGKTVAVVGSGASAIQIVPAIASTVAKMTVYLRTPNWVLPRNDAPYEVDALDAFQSQPGALRAHQRALYRRSLIALRAFHGNDKAMQMLTGGARFNLMRGIPDPEMRRKLTPDYPLGCKRVLVSDDYYPALARDNVELVTDRIERLTPSGIVSAGEERAFDAIIYCTGYNVANFAGRSGTFDIIGRQNRRLSEQMGLSTEAYRGVLVPGFPNHFWINGPNGASGYTSIIATAEIQMAWVVRLIQEAAAGGVGAIEVDPACCRDHMEQLQREFVGTTWAAQCTSLYKDERGRVIGLFPGTIGRIRREIAAISLDHLETEPCVPVPPAGDPSRTSPSA